nr:At2g41280 [Arabidopsis thaliana]BAC42584.1 putative late embryogenesis abundant M10 protein [Arabidopsis thaliana]
MGNLMSLVLVALLFSLSLAVIADTSNDATHVKEEVKPSTEATGAIEAEVEVNDAVVEPQQGLPGGGCRFGCCGGYWWNGLCIYCCRSQAEANEVVKTVEPQKEEAKP